MCPHFTDLGREKVTTWLEAPQLHFRSLFAVFSGRALGLQSNTPRRLSETALDCMRDTIRRSSLRKENYLCRLLPHCRAPSRRTRTAEPEVGRYCGAECSCWEPPSCFHAERKWRAVSPKAPLIEVQHRQERKLRSFQIAYGAVRCIFVLYCTTAHCGVESRVAFLKHKAHNGQLLPAAC